MNLLNKLNQTNKSEAGLYWPVSKYTVNAAQNIGQGLNSAKTKEQYKLLINFLQDVNQVTRPGFQTSTFPKKFSLVSLSIGRPSSTTHTLGSEVTSTVNKRQLSLSLGLKGWQKPFTNNKYRIPATPSCFRRIEMLCLSHADTVSGLVLWVRETAVGSLGNSCSPRTFQFYFLSVFSGLIYSY